MWWESLVDSPITETHDEQWLVGDIVVIESKIILWKQNFQFFKYIQFLEN